jgi:hypothetical protein
MCSTAQDWTGGTRNRPALLPVWQLSDDEVETALAQIEQAEAALVARRAALVAEADQRSMKDRCQALSTERWLQDRFRLSHRDAKTRVEQARLVTGQPAAHQALAVGRVTVEQAGVIATALDAVDQLPGVDPVERGEAAQLLVEQAAALGPRHLAAAAAHLVEQLTRTPSTDTLADTEAVARELAAAEAAAQAAETNTLVVKYRPDGSIDYRGRLCPVDAPLLSGWLKQADKKHAGTDGFEDDRPREQRRGDHLSTTLRHALTTGAGGAGGGRTMVHVTVTTTLDALREQVTGAGVLDTGGTLSASELRRLACDAGITPLVLGGPSQVLDYGRTRRTYPLAPRRALVVRDRGCVAPGCDRAPAGCDAHHQWEWDHGGPTDLANGALLCTYHHQQIHRQGWTVQLARNGYPELIPPTSIDPTRRPRQHHRFQLTMLSRRRT